jgi:histidinol-phosphate aminotransferase
MRTASIPLYETGRVECRIDLSDNTNAWGMAPASASALQAPPDASRYPSAYADDLKAAIADYTRLPTSMITTGCGSDDVLDSAIRVLASPGDRLLYTKPTFAMIPVFASLNGVVPVAVPPDRLADRDAKIIYICSPNNPTGDVFARDAIERVLSSCPGAVVIVDEAYAEFAGVTVLDLLSSRENLVVTRTLSKAFGLAGIRVGYGLGAPAVIREIEKSRGPYKVASLSEKVAVAALTDGRQWMQENAAKAVAVREQLSAELKRRGYEPLESATNFVFVPLENARPVGAAMAERGVRVRVLSDPAGLRITVAPWPVMIDALTALDEARRQCE